MTSQASREEMYKSHRIISCATCTFLLWLLKNKSYYDLFFSNHTISCIHDVTSPLDVKKCKSRHYQLYPQYYHILFKANQVETCLTCMSAHIKTNYFISARSFRT